MKRSAKDLPHAFVFGNAAFDEVFLVSELPKPGESVLGAAGHAGLGGKGANQAIALARTGVPTTFVASVGTDRHGRAVQEALSREELDTALLGRPALATDRSIVFAQANGNNVIVTTNACAASISIEECLPPLAKARAGDAVLLQGNLRSEVTLALCLECKQRGLYLVLNPSPFDAAFADLVPLVDALFVNETEAMELTGRARKEAVQNLIDMGAKQVILTLSSDGALLGLTDRVIDVPAATGTPVDVTGAGDCFEGVAIGSALTRGTPIDAAALYHAAQAAAYAIGSVGAADSFPSPKQIATFISNGPAS